MNQKLKATRKARNLKQREVAIESNISTRQYRNIEAGKAKPNVETAISIAQALGSTVDALFTPSTTVSTNAPVDATNKGGVAHV